jgi:NCS2 family nucleobase:cation symporter-2
MAKDEENPEVIVEKNPCGGVSCSAQGLVGDYNYGWLCLCNFLGPLIKPKPPPFLKKEEQLPLLVSLVMGLQHMLAMLGGIITPPKLITGDACFAWQKDQALCDNQQYLISCALMTSGLLTIIQVIRLKFCCNYTLGTGLISVMGTSFTFLPLAREIVTSEIKSCNAAGTGPCGMDAYGKLLGTCIVASGLEVVLSFIHPKMLRRLFPPIVSGTCVVLIGVSLCSAGIKYWGGGVFCAENDMSAAMAFGSPRLCGDPVYDEVKLGYGSKEYLILGGVVLGSLVVLQIFGSPFLKNASVVVAMLIGYVFAAWWKYTDDDGNELSFVPGFPNTPKVEAAKWIEYPDPTKFKLGFYLPGLMPLLLGFLITTIETIGDVEASMDASMVPNTGPDAEARIQGGLLADGINSAIACLLTVPPNTTFSQNNGVIALTRCASRGAGLACAFWLILFGVIGKFGGFIASIPDATLGGMTIFLFSNVVVSGISIIGKTTITHRSRFILAMALGVGIGVACEPHFAEGGGLAAFYGGNLKHNGGFWPKSKVCKVFPTATTTTFSCTKADGSFEADFSNYGGDCSYEAKNATGSWCDAKTDCEGLGGTFDTASTSAVVKTCIGNNGFCCLKYDDEHWDKWMLRETIVLILKTPYCVGTLIALILNLLLPWEKEGEEIDEVVDTEVVEVPPNKE